MYLRMSLSASLFAFFCSSTMAIAINEPDIVFKKSASADLVSSPPALALPARELEKMTRDKRFLQKMNDYSTKRKVALIQVKPDGSAILNPEMKGTFIEYEYVHIPKNADLTQKDCDELWGPTVSTSPEFRTYQLELAGKKLPDDAKKRYFIDTIFQDSKLLKYRIRGAEIKLPQWNEV